MNAVTQVVENSDFATKGLSLGLLNISAYAKTIKTEVETITKTEVSDSSIVMALSRYGKLVRRAGIGTRELKLANITSRSQLVEVIYPRTPEVQERYAMLNMLDTFKHAPFFVSTVGLSELTIVLDESLLGALQAHFGSLQQQSAKGSLAGLTVRVVDVANQPNWSYYLLERLATRNITIEDYVANPMELTIILHEKDVLKAFQMLHGAFLSGRN